MGCVRSTLSEGGLPPFEVGSWFFSFGVVAALFRVRLGKIQM